MSAPIRISLKAGERIYINGAVLRAQRKLTFELLNNAVFLLENHILQQDEATTPLRQLYYALQTILIDPGCETARDNYWLMQAATERTFTTTEATAGLRLVGRLVEQDKVFEALKTLRNLFAVEEAILREGKATRPAEEKSYGREHDLAGV